MKRVRFIAVIVPALMLLMLLASPPHAQVLTNGQGVGSTTTATPVPIGTSTPVLLIPPNKDRICSYTLAWSEAGSLICQPVATGTTAAAQPPTAAGNGFKMAPGPTWMADELTDDPRLGQSCVSSSGTLNVSTHEVYHCANTKSGM